MTAAPEAAEPSDPILEQLRAGRDAAMAGNNGVRRKAQSRPRLAALELPETEAPAEPSDPKGGAE